MSDGEVRPFLGKALKISFKNLLTYYQNAILIPLPHFPSHFSW